jgi:predicted Zn-dependent protease
MYRAGYDPEAMTSFQTKLGRLQSGKSSRVLNFLSTHPLSEARINAINQEIAALPPSRDVGVYAERYRERVGRGME